ncbi:S-phase kinase-associated protein 2 [Condylostylus longicornis]|uniref:S-phase kinase-associated protein 2 n=1 Tax=Condylostylus longicornis TaxID=2530218 RepID=UPI00244DD00E|nr:S-phase kinase-associated protein 2 [Condylostylus longicornis]
MNFKRKSSFSSNENLCPVETKRPKLSKTWKSSNTVIDRSPCKSMLKEHSINMLESDESCSGTSLSSHNNETSGSDENSNEQTPIISAPVLIHRNYDGNFDYLNQTVESENNTSFTDPNETLKQKGRANNVSDMSTEKGKIIISNVISGKGRSPLATVVCNNNNYVNANQKGIISMTNSSNPTITNNSTTHISQATTSTEISFEANCSLQQLNRQIPQNVLNVKKSFIPNENFFLYRTIERSNFSNRDPFKKLSDEMILQIFKWLPKKTLIRCSFVCSRFNRLSQDESLWSRLDLGNKTLRSGALGNIVSRGIVILRLAQADIAHPIFDPERSDFFNEFESKLQYLDLSMAIITKPSLKVLLSKCRQLKKLSLEHVPLSDAVCDEISKNINLEALNLAMCEGIEQWSVLKMMKGLQQLHSLNISWTSLSIESITALVQNLTPNILRLNIAGCRKNIFDSHVSVLSSRCRSLLELDLSDCTGLTSATINTVCKFKELEYLSLSRCYGINAASYVELKNVKSLAYLDVFGILQESALITLQNTFPAVGINKFIHSSVARPTVGSRRTSIWGLRTRD